MDCTLLEGLPVIPVRQQEVKQLLLWKQTQDEAQAIQFLVEENNIGSVAATFYGKWQLDRQLIEERHANLCNSRTLQATLNNIIGASRFKTLDGSKLMKAR